MAGDWIKMRSNLDTDPRVVSMAAKLNLPELHIVGALWKVWSWADQHSLDGKQIKIDKEIIDRITFIDGLSTLLIDNGWLVIDKNSITFPNFTEHNGSTAKTRALGQRRQAKYRNDKVTLDKSPEKRREENKNIQKNFIEFWESYPRKTAKSQAWKAWQKLNPSDDLCVEILKSLSVHKSTEQWQGDGGKYIPYGSTWLNQKRWEDEVKPVLRAVGDSLDDIPDL